MAKGGGAFGRLLAAIQQRVSVPIRWFCGKTG